MSLLSDLLRRFGSKQSQPSQPSTQVSPDLGFGSSGSTTAMLPPPRTVVVPPPQPQMSVAPPKPSYPMSVNKPLPAPAPQQKPGLIKKLAKSVAPDSYANIKQGIQSDKVTDQLASGAKLAVNLPKELIVRPALRTAFQFPKALVDNVRELAGGQKAQAYTPGNVVTKTIFGEEPIQPIDQETGELVGTGYELAKQYSPSSAAGVDPNDPTSKLFAGAMTPFFALTAGGMKALDLEPGGAGPKKVLKEGAEKLLKEGAERTAKEAAERLAKEEAEAIVKQAPNKFLDNVLSKATPRYNYGSKAFTPAFESDLDKAAFILAQKNPSKREADFLSQAIDASGMTEAELRAHGQEVKNTIKSLARDAEPGNLSVPKMTPKRAQESAPLMSRIAGTADEAPTVSKQIATDSPAPSLQEEVSQLPQTKSEIPPAGGPSTKPDGDVLSYTDKVPPKKDLINLDHLGLSDAQKDVARGELDKIAKTSEEIVGKPLTWKEVEAHAKEAQKIYDDLPVRDETKEVIASARNLRDEISADIQSGKLGPDLQDKLLRLKAYSTDVARQLNALGMNVKGESQSGFQTVLKALQKEGNTLDGLIESAKKYDLKDPEQLSKWYRENSGRNWEQFIDTLRYNSMLSSPRTHSTNIFSNLVGSTMVAPVQKVVTGMIDATRSLLTGTPREALVGEAPAYLKGYVTHVGEAVDNFWQTLKGTKMGDVPDIRDIPLTEKGTLARLGENVLRTPMRFLEAQDQFFKAMTKGGEKEALLYRIAKTGQNKSMRSVEKTAEAAADYRLFKQGLKTKDQGVVLDAFDSMTALILKARNDKNPILRTIAKWSLPFVTTSTNTAKQMIEYSPLGFTTLLGAGNKQEQLAKAIMGTAAATGVATLMGSERLTGAAPTSTDEANRWKAAGIQPWSVKVGDKWYSYQNIHPALGINFAIITSLDKAVKDGKISDRTAEKLWGTAMGTLDYWADQSYMKALGDINKGLSGDPQRAASFFANYPKQLIPFRALQGWLARAMDDVERQVDPNASFFQKQLQTLKMDIPGLSEQNMSRINPKTGEPIKRQNKLLNSFSPVRVTTETKEAEQIRQESEAKEKYSDLAEQDKIKSAEMKRQALELYWQLKQMDQGEANGRAQALQKSDPELYKRLADVVAGVKKRSDADAAELQKLNINTGSRARAVWRNLMQLETKEEKNGYLKDLFDRKVINKEIMEQLGKIKAEEANAKAPQP